MRKKIALFANGWGNECLMEVGTGIHEVAKKNDIDVFAFVNHVAIADDEQCRLGEFNIFTVPDLNDFDGVVSLTTSFNIEMERKYVEEAVKKAGIPAVSVESKLDGMDFFGSDDYHGMSEVVEHLIKDHDVKDILYIGGIEGHEGDAIRRKAVVETALKLGITIPDDNFLTGDFAAAKAIDEFIEWRKDHTLPEAIICANDMMAIGITDYLKEERINVPEEVKVTGFDCLSAAGEFDPSITSVNREWVLMGKKIMENLIKRINGETPPKEVILDTKMIVGESCGCVLSREDVYTWKNLRENVKDHELNGFGVDRHFRRMFVSMRKISDKEGMNKALSDFFLKEGWLEGTDMMLALVPDFFEFTDVSDENKITWGYPDAMDEVCFISDKKPYGIRRDKTSHLIYELSNRNPNAGVYIFIPIRTDTEMYGFGVITKGFGIIRNDIPYIWSRHVSQYLELIKSNVAISHLNKKLEALSVTDGLTGAYNRAGCETIIYTRIQECQKKGGRAVVMLADVDRLKKINDKFGHGAGDIAITSSINLLKKHLPKDAMIGRFGGDEFLVAVLMEDKIDADDFANELMGKIVNEASEQNLEFNVSLSIGAIQMSSGEAFSIKDQLPLMDKKVYEIKEIHHREDDSRQEM